ncbi:hypothetical protein C0J52_07903 [Blattella germanica]|nr:hypothetical protein C0J52_07903 [Blattella germanica]
MDEVLFHVSQSLEALQVHLYSGVQHGRLLLHGYADQAQSFALDVWSAPRVVQIQESVQHTWQWLLEFSQEMKRMSLQLLNPQQLYAQLMQFIGAESMYRLNIIGLMVVDDVPAPVITMLDEVLVQVKAASVDHIDIKICSGYGRVLRKQLARYNHNATGVFPVILGRDCAGIIIEIGQKVSKFEIGDEVWFAVPYWMPGTMAEYVVVKESHIAKKPKAIGFEIAASLPYAGAVAWDAMVNQAHLDQESSDGKRVLVHMGCSPVGCILIQLARLWGAHVTATASLRATPVAQALGAHDVVVCGEADVQKQLAIRDGFDVIFNTEGSVAHEPCQNFCKPGGFVVTPEASKIRSDSFGFLFGTIYAFWIRFRCLVQGPALWGSDNMGPAVLDRLAQLLEDGSLQPVVDKIFAPQDAELAFHHADSAEAIGKTIIRFRYPGASPYSIHLSLLSS